MAYVSEPAAPTRFRRTSTRHQTPHRRPTPHRCLTPRLRQRVSSIAARSILLGFCLVCIGVGNPSWAQADAFAGARADSDTSTDDTNVRRGVLIEVTDPLTPTRIGELSAALDAAAQNAARSGPRTTLVLRIKSDGDDANVTAYEDALRLTRLMSNDSLRRLRIVVWVDGSIRSHAALLLTAAEQILVSSSATLGSIDDAAEPDIVATYRVRAARRGVMPESLAAAIADGTLELSSVETGGGTKLLSGDDLKNARDGGNVVRETVWSDRSKTLSLNAADLRKLGVATAQVDSLSAAAEFLDLADLEPFGTDTLVTEPVGVLMNLVGTLNAGRQRRLQSNLAAVGPPTNTLMVRLDSSGGDLNASAAMASTLVAPNPPIVRTAVAITGEARADAALVAMAADRLWIQTDGRLGGPGSVVVDPQSIEDQSELLDLIAKRTGRSRSLIRAVLLSVTTDGGGTVYTYTNNRTGAVAYAGVDDSATVLGDGQTVSPDWVRGEAIDLSEGLDAATAVRLGLADGTFDRLAEVPPKLGLQGMPPPLEDRRVVRWIERIGNSFFLKTMILILAMAALSAELNAPGLGVPGFIALVAFALFVWANFLNGTAEWFEILLLFLGLACVAIEIFVIPGTGIFGIGGFLMTIGGIVLVSQSFLLPANGYQLSILNRGVWMAIASLAVCVLAFALCRMFLPRVPVLGGLIMESIDGTQLDQNERLANFDHLIHQVGVASTPLRLSGKAIFGDEVVAVVSDGMAIEKNQSVRVVEVQANRVVVEPVDA